MNDLEEWRRRIFEEPEPVEEVILSINGKDYRLRGVTTTVEVGELEDPLAGFIFELGAPTLERSDSPP